MSVDATITTMKLLKLHGMAQSITELAAQASPAYSKAEPILQQLLKAEVAEREVRSIQYQMKVARFPAYRDLTGFDFMQSEINEELMTALHHCEFMEEAQNIVFVGGPGTGKTHLATAIAVQAIQHHHKRIRFLSTIELANLLEQEKQIGKQRHMAALSDPNSLWCLNTILTARSRISGAYLFFVFTTPFSQVMASPTNPGRFTWHRVTMKVMKRRLDK